MARAGRGGNTSLRGGVAGGEGAPSLFLAVFLVPLVIFKLAREDRRKRGLHYTAKDIAAMFAIGAAALAITAVPIVIFR